MAYRISSIKAKCFKSIGKEGLGVVRLGAGLTVICGPNGCGKSTLLSSILFAFACPHTLFCARLEECRCSDAQNEVLFAIQKLPPKLQQWKLLEIQANLKLQRDYFVYFCNIKKLSAL